MRILSKQDFLKTPAGTVFHNFEPSFFTGLYIKVSDYTFGHNDFVYQELLAPIDANNTSELFELIDKAELEGADVPLDFKDSTMREGLFDDEKMYAVLSKQEVRGLIDALSATL